ncbi:MAG: hypothetical protein KKA81_15570 [Bacteroidetes bacterium]|nr:hypothetical protein [Bacteroidota bacterium]
MIEFTPIFILLIIGATIYGLVHLNIRKKERMAMLEKGADPKIFHTESNKVTTLKWGLVLIGISLGLFAGRALENSSAFQHAAEVGYFSMIFLFGGLALVISYFLERKEKNSGK